MAQMILPGPFCEVVKTGVYFSIDNDDRLFTGDLFYDIAKREFQMRGIPSWEGRKTHAIPVAERGPVHIHMLIKDVIQEAPRMEGKFTDIRFLKAIVCAPFVTWIEEWYGDRAIMAVIENHWKIEPNLAWVKG